MTKVLLGLVILSVAASTACATVKAKTAPERPPLEVPAPPAKVIETTPMPETPPDLVPDLPPEKPTSTRTSKPAAREAARTDPKPEPPATTDTASVPAAPVTPAPQLRPAGTDPSEATKQVQAMIQRAKQAISAVNCPSLTPPKKMVCENAHLTLKQAEEALNKSDFENAKKLAQKVEDTARELGAR